MSFKLEADDGGGATGGTDDALIDGSGVDINGVAGTTRTDIKAVYVKKKKKRKVMEAHQKSHNQYN
ncbi:hypothetical protein OsI_33206 [Oryza sativa Indica Group]|uniref:Uncharacterized protein n=2 Tax=Oryza sativa TaxID=4530 RepID=A3C3Y6_ORYSJ|nr:hypothetical protein OsI_33206 [Oryza sativa Indica Group]EAZ15799.1 hypothetical protein OsJ_31217 [Oryza sativa Japonica Group]